MDFIVNQIKKAARISKESGQAKYYQYFHPQTWRQYKEATDLKLRTQGYGYCIVEVD